MSAAGFLLGFLNVLLYCAVVILIAFVVLWLLSFVGIAVSENVLKWGKIVVGLLCIIAVVAWLLGAAGGYSYGPHLLFR